MSDCNVLSDQPHQYASDADGNSFTVDNVGVTYDALDRAVEQNRSGSYTQIVYSPGGAKLALMNGAALQKGFVALPGQAMAVYTSAGLDHYRHSDWLGNARLTSTPSRTVASTSAYAPFGETYAQSGTPDPSFTGDNQDTTTGDYDFLYREYNSSQGRWPQPDKAGLGAVNPANPQSWNRYAYVLNNPTNLTDPLGLRTCYFEDGDSYTCPGDDADSNNPPPNYNSPPGLVKTDGLRNRLADPNQGLYKPGQDIAKIPDWWWKMANPDIKCEPNDDCSNLPKALQYLAYELLDYDPRTGKLRGVYSNWQVFFDAMGIPPDTTFPAFLQADSSPPQSAKACAQAGNAISSFVKKHPGVPPPSYLFQALERCSVGGL